MIQCSICMGFEYQYLFYLCMCVVLFQDYDPKGTGVLRAKDVPTALGAAICLFTNRMDTERLGISFYDRRFMIEKHLKFGIH